MSLYKQFWLSIGGLMAIVLVATLLVMSMAAKRYLEHHVFLNNVDRASVFAHRIEALGDDTEASRELLEKQFRSGQYEEITLTEANGELIGHWHGPAQTATVPGWFHRILALDVPAGSAQLNADTEVVTVRSQTRLADESMWRASLAVTAVCLLAAAIAGFLGTLILRKTLKPLQTVVHQANAIGQRRFITVSEPPSRELSAAVRAMNELSGRVKAMLEAQSVRLEKVQSTANRDELTGLLDREQFIRELGSVLQADDYNTSGVISLVRVAGLSMLNQVHGRDTVDSVLGSFGKTLIELQEYHRGTLAARLNGADFVLLAPREMDAGVVGRDLQKAMREVLQERGLGDSVELPAASTTYMPGDSATDLLTNLDSALLNSEVRCESELVTMGRDGIQMMPARQELKRWRSMLSLAFAERRFDLATFPVTTLSGELLHNEAPARLNWQEKVLTAGQFLPWINRLELASELDREVVELALNRIERDGVSMGINLSGAALVEDSFLPWLSQRLSSQAEAAARLWLEVPEPAAYRHLEGFKRMCARCKRYGTRVGLEHVGHQLSDIGRLHDVGVDFVKVDSAFVRDVDTNPANQTLLRTLCTLAHSLGVQVIAEGVKSKGERDSLADLGFDAITGPQVSAVTAQASAEGETGAWVDGQQLATV